MPAHSTTGLLNLRLQAQLRLLVGCKVSLHAIFHLPYYGLVTYRSGWITVFAWQATTASLAYLIASQIQGLAILNYDSYNPQPWHITLTMWAIMALAFTINVNGIRILPHFESLAGVCHVLFFFALLIPLVYLAPRSTAAFVFTEFDNSGGWSSNGVSWCVGLLTVTYPFVGECIVFEHQGSRLIILTGFDGVVHMSKQVMITAYWKPLN